MKIRFLKDLIFNGKAVKAGSELEVTADKHVSYCLGRKLAVVIDTEKTVAESHAGGNSKASNRKASDEVGDFLDGDE